MMKKKMINHTLLSVAVLAIAGCGGSGDSNEPAQGAAVAQSESAAGTPYVGITDEELGWRAEVPETQTAALQVNDEFDFATSRRNKVELYIPEAAGQNAEAAFCTDYTQNGADYEVNYESCVLHAPLVGGTLSEDVNLVNQHGKVLSIVWLEDPSKPPIYQEFTFD